MSKKVVLARPHPFIRKPMTELLAKLGYTPVTELASGKPAGVIISSSVTSEGGSFQDVLKTVRKTWADAPLIVATLLKPDMARKSLGKELAEVFPGKKIGFPSEGKSGDILIVGPDDLKLPATEKLIQGFLK